MYFGTKSDEATDKDTTRNTKQRPKFQMSMQNVYYIMKARYTAKSEIIFHGMSDDYIHISIYIFNNVTFVMSVRWKRHLRWKRFKDLHASTSASSIYTAYTALRESSFAYTSANKINPFLFVGVIIKHMWCAVQYVRTHISLNYLYIFLYTASYIHRH